MKGSLIQNR
jgi:hypothetical protein